MASSDMSREQGKITVLIVEDHDAVRVSLREKVRASFPEVRIFEAASGEEALSLALREWPQIVLMDINLPGMSGIDATRQIKSRMPGAYVVAVSVYEDQAHRAAAMEAGATAYIAKRNISEELNLLLNRVAPSSRVLTGPKGKAKGAVGSNGRNAQGNQAEGTAHLNRVL